MTGRDSLKKARKWNKGFTTVELIVVVVIVLILAGGLVFAGSRWARNIRFGKQNEYARTIFVAAQNQLTEYSESGQMEKLQKQLQNSRGVYENQVQVEKLLDSEGKPYQLEELWPESKDVEAPDSPGKYQGIVCSLIGRPQDYEQYQEGSADKQTKALYDMLSSYLYDTSILAEGVVCLEFTPEDGQVFAALYSDSAEDFTYTPSEELSGTVSISSRELPYRKARMVGYYGVDALYKATSTKMEKPSIAALRLNNEDTLNLSFQIGKVAAAAGELQYEITVYEKNGNARLSFVLDGTKLKNKENAELIPCNVFRYQYPEGSVASVSQYLGSYDILAWLEEGSNPQVRIVLDGADQNAISELYKEAFKELTFTGELVANDFDTSGFSMSGEVGDLKKTQSFRRFGLLGVEDIYCTVRGTGSNYKPTAKKQSNTENWAFAQAALSPAPEGGGKAKATYTLKNARHLYNMRYLEDYTKEEREKVEAASLRKMDGDAEITYQLGGDIDWTAFVDGGSLYTDGKVEKEEKDFTSIIRLRESSQFLGNERQDYTISGLSISATHNQEKEVYRNEDGEVIKKSPVQEVELAAGLFLKNEGKIQWVSLDQITVEGGKNVGAFCGANQGVLKNLTVKNTKPEERESVIQGVEAVGGVVGVQLVDAAGDGALQELVNYARVTEREEVLQGESPSFQREQFGGIIGHINTDAQVQKLQIINSRNYGIVAARKVKNLPAGKKQEETQKLGGIAGSAKAVGYEQEALFRQCVSSPQYTEGQIAALLKDEGKELKEALYGKYVGGIVGHNDGGIIEDCGTVKENYSKEGYVLGGSYVGGIIGFNEKKEARVEGGTATHGVNQAHVLGREFVGGVVGGNPNGQIIEWKNEGFVAATEKYAGGISGHNGLLPEGADVRSDAEKDARILDCGSEVARTAAVSQLSTSGLFQANYVGGISGYNNARITTEKRGTVSLVSTLTGGNFVGGVVGYNDVDAVVENYQVVGGYIDASGAFVGGFCGLNASIRLLQSEEGTPFYVRSNPNQVKGGYCVGGVIGGNIVPADKEDKGAEIKCGFEADNFLGSLEATGGYAGGYIGCNWMVKRTDGIRSKIMAAAEATADKCQENKEGLAGNEEKRKEALIAISGITELLSHGEGEKKLESSVCKFVIDGEEENESNEVSSRESSQARLGGVKGLLYVGGVIGCNEPNTLLEIRHVVNKTPVTATESVEALEQEKGKTTYLGQVFRYSYAGGVIGKVTKLVTLDNCRNQDSGSVVAAGTYTGGLCEINEGLIKNCTASSLGSSKKDYVGGIVGLNKGKSTENPEGGRVVNCSLEEGRTVTGGSYVGGIAAENYGTIRNPEVKGNVRSYGTGKNAGYVGGITAYNHKEGTIELPETVGQKSSQVTAAGSYAGSVAGVNAGSLKSLAPNAEGKIVVQGAVGADKYAGGVVGKNEAEETLAGYTNQAAVTAENGFAGGIAGATAGNISSCVNEGLITARLSGEAGGIVAVNTGTINNCTDTGVVGAPNGQCGGIAAVNQKKGTITGCSVYGKSAALTFIGKESAGGVCAENKSGGKIQNSSVYNVVLNDLADSPGSWLGGIAGLNESEISGCTVGWKSDTDTSPVQLVSLTTGASAGGAVGRNGEGGKVTDTKIQAGLSFKQEDMAYYGYLGGVAGVNHGALEECAFSGTVTGTANNPGNPPQYDPNRDSESSGAVIYGYGGIAGLNGKLDNPVGAKISGCTVSDAKITGIGDATNIANVGGVAGVNAKGAEIRNTVVGKGDGNGAYKPLNQNNHLVKKATYNVYVGTKAFGHTGGVAGLNGGVIEKINYEVENDGVVTPPTASVAVENYRGHVGGATGYNRKTGLVSQVQTGQNWLVYAPENANDNGCGGIIGYQAGEGEIENCINRARVVKTVSGSNGVGGLIGRMEVATARNYLIKDCTNYGELYGYARVGGMIGVAKYYGGNLSGCVNYGKISATANGVAGMIGHLYGMIGAVNLNRCENHGFIDGGTTADAAGMIGASTTAGAGNPLVHLWNCVNTGLIWGKTRAGILGVASLYNGSDVINCRNYGYAYGSNEMGGIMPAGTGTNAKIEGCFGVSQLTYPIASSASNNSDHNYYITKDSGGEVVTTDPPGAEEVPFYVYSVEAPGISSPEHLYKIVGQAEKLDLDDGGRAWFPSNTKSKVYTFTFSKAINLKKLTLYWHDQRGTREQDYIIEYSPYTSGGAFEQCANKNNTAESGCAPQKQEIALDKPVKARRIRITVTNSKSPDGKSDVNACLIRAHFSGTDTTNNNDIYFTGQLKNIGNNNTYESSISGLSTGRRNNTTVTYPGRPYEICVKGTTTSAQGIGTPVEVVPVGESGASYKLEEERKLQVGLSGFSMDPYREFQTASGVTTDNALTVLGDEGDNIRYQVFEADDWAFVPTLSVGELKKPTDVKFTGISGGVKLSWSTVQNAQYYEYTVTYCDEQGDDLGTRTDIVYGTSVELPVTSINGTPVKGVKGKVRAGAVTAAGEVWSDPSDEATYKITAILPTPQFHLELVYDEGKLKYKAFLDNQSDYVSFLEKNELTDDKLTKALEEIQITIKAGTRELTFTAASAKSTTYFEGYTTNNTMFIAFAKDTSGRFTTSAEIMRESLALEHGSYVSENPFVQVRLSQGDDSEVGFYGDTETTLQYMAKLKYNENWTYYMRTELLATATELGVPVSVSSSEVRISKEGTTEFIKTMLASLPSDLMNEDRYEDITLRSYPSLMSNNVVYNGHEVDLSSKKGGSKLQGVTRDQLKELKVTVDGYLDDNSNIKLIDDGKLAGGYVIRLLPDGSYGLYYNALLAYNADNHLVPDSSSNTTQMKTQVYTYQWSKDTTARLEKQPTPEIRVNVDVDGNDGDPNEDIMEITWDINGYKDTAGNVTNNYKDGAVYDYTVTGQTLKAEADGKYTVENSVQIVTGQYTTSSQGEETNVSGPNRLTLDTTSWKYDRVLISISRRGVVDEKGKTKTLPNGRVKEVNLRLSLSQVESPSLMIHYEGGAAQKDALNYDVTWSNIPKEEWFELDGYEIRAVRNAASDKAAVESFEDEEKFRAEWTELLDLYKEKFGEPKSHTTGGADGIRGTQSGSIIWKKTEGSVTKTMELKLTISEEPKQWTITKDLEVVKVKKLIGDEKKEPDLTEVIDLSDYEAGEALLISVRALATEDAQKYRNGPAGVPAEMTLPSRLSVPLVTKLRGEPEYDLARFMTAQEIEKEGLTLTYADEGQTAKGNYQLAIAVYVEKAGEDKSQVTEDWSKDAIEGGVLFSKEKPAVMGGSLNAAAYNLKELQRDYGGMWLKIAMRSVSDSHISSWWSDEDPAADGTENYQWIRIPRVQEDTPVLEQESQDLSYVYNSTTGQLEYSDTEDNQVVATRQTRLSWEKGKLADHYKIGIVRYPKYDEEDKYARRLVDWVYLQRAGEGYQVFYLSSDPNFDGKQASSASLTIVKEPPISDDAVYVGELSLNGKRILPWTGTAYYEGEEEPIKISTASWLAFTKNDKGEERLTLQLPDVEQVGTESKVSLETEQIAIQAMIDPKKQENYQDSDIKVWYRSGSEAQVLEKELKEQREAPGIVLSYEWNEGKPYLTGKAAEAWLVCRVATGEKSCYLSSYGQGISEIENYLLLPEGFLPERTEQKQVINLEVKVAAIGLNGEGLSKWADLTIPVTIPPKEEINTPPTPTPEEAGPDTAEGSATGEPGEGGAEESTAGEAGQDEAESSAAGESGQGTSEGGAAGEAGSDTQKDLVSDTQQDAILPPEEEKKSGEGEVQSPEDKNQGDGPTDGENGVTQ